MGTADPCLCITKGQHGNKGCAAIMGFPGDGFGVGRGELEEADEHADDEVVGGDVIVVDEHAVSAREGGVKIGFLFSSNFRFGRMRDDVIQMHRFVNCT